MRTFLTNRARAESVNAVISRSLGREVTTSTGRILALLEEHPDFWCNEEDATRLRDKLSVVTYRLTGEANSAITLADRIMRDQAGVPQREDDTDSVFEDYKTSEGLKFKDGGTEYVVVGPCPVSQFRQAVVMRTSDSSLQIMRWSRVAMLAGVAAAAA